jgi:hypothetical protein
MTVAFDCNFLVFSPKSRKSNEAMRIYPCSGSPTEDVVATLDDAENKCPQRLPAGVNSLIKRRRLKKQFSFFFFALFSVASFPMQWLVMGLR